MPVFLPLIEKIMVTTDVPTLFERLASRPYSFLLDSGLIVQGLGRYSLLGSDPFLVLHSREKNLWLEREGNTILSTGHPLEKLRDLLAR
ncbi:MAG: aminodeoxychorismate synthase, component I, partial [Desulfofundulus sp.]